MIVVQIVDPALRKSVRRAALLEEDVVSDEGLVADAIDWGFPRLIVTDGRSRSLSSPHVPVLELDSALLRTWEAERRSHELPPSRVAFITRRVAALIEASALERSWVDGALADLTRAAGAQFPRPLRTFARRVLEFPGHYTSLYPLADVSGYSRGALKAKFRRRGLATPTTYLRWLRVVAVAHLLADRSITVATAARRMGFTSDGNLCRMMDSVCGMTPTEVRNVLGWNRLLLTFAWQHLTPDALEAWGTLDELFGDRVA